MHQPAPNTPSIRHIRRWGTLVTLAWILAGGSWATSSEPPTLEQVREATRVAQAADGTEPSRLEAVGVLARTGSWSAASTLALLLDPDEPEAVRRAARAGLGSLAALPVDWSAERCRAWVESHRMRSAEEWAQLLAGRHRARAESLEADRESMTTELLDALSRVHVMTPTEERPQLLAMLLKHPRRELRDLGFRLVSRELSAAHEVGEPVSDAAMELLASPVATDRAQAAALVNQLAPPGASDRVHEALRNETDEAVARALIRTAARWPNPQASAPMRRWLQESDETALAVIETWWAFRRSGLSLEDADSRAGVQRLRHVDLTLMTPSACRFAVTYGDAQDLQRVALLMLSSDSTLRQASASALASRPETLDGLLRAARRDSSLFEIAAGAAAAHRATAEGYVQVAELPVPEPERKAQALRTLALALPSSELLALSSQLRADASELDTLLSVVEEPGRDPGLNDPGTIDALRFKLARVRLEASRPDRALEVLNRIASEDEHAELLTRLRLLALLRLNRMEQAERLDANASLWLDAMENTSRPEHAGAVLDAFERIHGPSLAEPQRDRFNAVVARWRLPVVNTVEPEATEETEASEPGAEQTDAEQPGDAAPQDVEDEVGTEAPGEGLPGSGSWGSGSWAGARGS